MCEVRMLRYAVFFSLLVALLFVGCFSTGGGDSDDDDTGVDDDVTDDDSSVDDDTTDDDITDDDITDDDVTDDDTDDDYEECADQSNLGYDEGDTMANFTLYDENGDPLSLYDLCYNVVLLVSSTGWCPNCAYEAAHIVEDIYNHYEGQPFKIFYTLFEDDVGNPPSQAYLQAYKEKYGLPFHVYADTSGALFRYQDTYPTLYVPFNIVADKNLIVRYEQAGYFPNSIRGIIDTYIDD